MDGNRPHEDSSSSKALFQAVTIARKALISGYHDLPSRDLLDSFPLDPGKISVTKHWTCQVFIDGIRFLGSTDTDLCFLAQIDEVVRYMASKKMMQIRIPADLHKWFKLYAAKNDTTMTEIVISYLNRIRHAEEGKIKVDQI